jgi:hypothetical protein
MQINPWIRHDRLDDMVMVIDLETGAYYTFENAAADIWTLFADGREPAAVLEVLVTRYVCDAPAVTADVERFAAALIAHNLLVADSPPTEPTVILPTLDPLLAYITPEVERFDELADMVLMDPIHEVDEAAGWPVPRAD